MLQLRTRRHGSIIAHSRARPQRLNHDDHPAPPSANHTYTPAQKFGMMCLAWRRTCAEWDTNNSNRRPDAPDGGPSIMMCQADTRTTHALAGSRSRRGRRTRS